MESPSRTLSRGTGDGEPQESAQQESQTIGLALSKDHSSSLYERLEESEIPARRLVRELLLIIQMR